MALTWIILNGSLLLWMAIFVAFALASVAMSRLYCGWVCPMSLLMDVASYLQGKLGHEGPSRPSVSRRPWLQGASLAVFFGALVAAQLLHLQLPLLPLLLAIAVIVSLLAHESLFHSSICPFGIIQSWSSRWAPWGTRVDADRCVACEKCEEVCPNRCAKVNGGRATIEPGQCLQCGRCVDICPKDAIEYGSRKVEMDSSR